MVNKKKYISLAVIFIFIAGWSVLLYFIRPTEIVEQISAGGGYGVLFSMSIFGALASLTTFTAYPALVTLTLGELNPWFLILTASLGLIIGDLIFFGLAHEARTLFSEKYKSKIKYFTNWLSKRSDFLIATLVYIYVAFTPLPNNLLTGSLAMLEYPFKKVAWPVILGDTTLVVVVVVFTKYGLSWF